MEPWREKAVYLFPEFREDLRDPEYSIYTLFSDLINSTWKAHRRNDDQYLRWAYGFAEWCFNQEEKDLWNAAGVSFYEDLFLEIDIGEKIVPWLSPDVIPDLRNLFAAVYGEKNLKKIDSLIADCTEWRYEETVYRTKWIEKI